MRKLRMIGATVGALVLTTMVLTSPAQADATWVANGESRITGQYTAVLKGGDTSVETTDLGVEVEAGTTVTFAYELLDGALCTAGAPRVFVVVDGVNTNSWDQNLAANKQCGEGGTVTFTIPAAGEIKQAGAVYDNGGVGSVKISALKIDGKKVAFKASHPTTGPTTGPTAGPTTGPTGGASVPPAAPGAGGGDGDLPLTGAAAGGIAVGALVLLAVGTTLFLVARRRRVTYTA